VSVGVSKDHRSQTSPRIGNLSHFSLDVSSECYECDSLVCNKNSNVWLLVCSVNGLYALYWDIVMDWGMMQNPSAVLQTACVRGVVVPEGREPTSCHHGLLRPQLRFGLSMSVLILLADSLLRFSWLLRFVTRFPSNDSFVLTTQFLEVFR
jgi:hypothetical protein